ncbi:MAG: DUF805 domain-containing protein [Bacteroidales bacterium]|nr:DUF805 domain-containing protein [Bacteroidales bacterium]
MDWYKQVVLKKYADFNGRASRPEFWYFVLANFLVGFILGFIKIGGYPIFSSIYSLAVLVPGLAVGARRLQDLGKSGWYLLFGLIPIAGAIILIVWFATEGEQQENSYGAVPSKEPEETTVS